MKFYNPFRPHIVEFAPSRFAVRKLSIIGPGWVYKEPDCDFYSENWSTIRSLDKAKERLAAKKEPKFKPRVFLP